MISLIQHSSYYLFEKKKTNKVGIDMWYNKLKALKRQLQIAEIYVEIKAYSDHLMNTHITVTIINYKK